MDRLDAGFFRQHPVECARALIGATFEWDGCAGRIVETEAYAETGDEACHTFFRPSARAFVAAHPEGTAYVYLNYGVHWLFNILVKGPQGAGFVLFRALEPVAGEARMIERRGTTVSENLCSGPGKLTQALGIGGGHHGCGFLGQRRRGIRPSAGEIGIVADPRIGISKGKELPWRFTEAGSSYVSRKPVGSGAG